MSHASFKTNFYQTFEKIEKYLNEISNKVESIANETEKKLQFTAEFEKITSEIDTLQKYFTENSSHLPNYEVRKAQEHLEKLSRLAQQKREQFFPKKKFGFKSKQNLTSLESKIETDTANTAANKAKSPDAVLNLNSESSCCLRGLRDQTIVKLDNEINGKDVAIIDAKNSTICLQGKF